MARRIKVAHEVTIKYERPPSERYLRLVRKIGEERALARIRATRADLRYWRRDPSFRERERAVMTQKPRRARLINLNALLTPDEAYQVMYARMARLGYESPFEEHITGLVDTNKERMND